jgi:hypothetical protein
MPRIPPEKPEKLRFCAKGALPHGNALFESLRILRVGEFQRKPFFQMAHHSGPAHCDLRQRDQ